MDRSGIADLAKTAQIDFIFLADRVQPGDTDFGIGGFTNDILFISGGAFDVGGSQIIGANIHEPIKPNLTPNDLISAIHDQGGLAIAADPAKFASSEDYALADAMEVYSQRSAWLAQNPTTLYLRAIFFGTDHFLTGLDVRPDANLALYDRMTTGARVCDARGDGRARQPQRARREGRDAAATLSVLHDPSARARARHGADPRSAPARPFVREFRLSRLRRRVRVLRARRRHDAMMGDEVHLAPGLTLKTELPARGRSNRDVSERRRSGFRRQRDDARVRAEVAGRIPNRSLSQRQAVDPVEPRVRTLSLGEARQRANPLRPAASPVKKTGEVRVAPAPPPLLVQISRAGYLLESWILENLECGFFLDADDRRRTAPSSPGRSRK